MDTGGELSVVSPSRLLSSGFAKPHESSQPRSPSSTNRICHLPAELRRQLLRELLFRAEPLEFNRGLQFVQRAQRAFTPGEQLLIKTVAPTSGLCPQILRTCKILYAEGSEVLYSNTINCRINEPFFRPDEMPLSVVVLSPSYLPSTTNLLPKAVLEKISRIRVQLFAHHQRSKRHASLHEMRAGVQKLAVLVRKAPAWQSIRIEMFHVYHHRKVEREPRTEADAAYFASALGPWRYVRNRSSVELHGVRGDLVKSLSALMTSREPFADLPMAMAALREYMQSTSTVLLQSQHPRSKLQTLVAKAHSTANLVCERAVRREDPEMFLRGRSKVMEMLSRIAMYKHKHVFKYDLDAWDAGPALSHHRNDKLLEQLDEESQPLTDAEGSDSDSDSTSSSDWENEPGQNGGEAQTPDTGYDDSEDSEDTDEDSDDMGWNSDEDEEIDSEYGWGPFADEEHNFLRRCRCAHCRTPDD